MHRGCDAGLSMIGSVVESRDLPGGGRGAEEIPVDRKSAVKDEV